MSHKLYHNSVQEGSLPQTQHWTLCWVQEEPEVVVGIQSICFAKKCFDPGDYSEQQSASSPTFSLWYLLSSYYAIILENFPCALFDTLTCGFRGLGNLKDNCSLADAC